MTYQYSNEQTSSTLPTANRLRPLSAYEQAQAQRLITQVMADSGLTQPQARWLGQRLWQQVQQSRFNLSQLRQWLQYQQDRFSHLLRYLNPRPHLWRQGGLTLTLAAGLTLSSLSQPLLTLAQEPIDDQFRVNTSSENVGNPDIGMAANGDFVVTWMSSGQDGDDQGIYARRYNATGDPLDNEFRVNNTTTDGQLFPSVGVAADGDFAISWTSRNQDGDGYGIYARRYDADGTPQSNEFQVNSYTTGNQRVSALGMAADGDFVITWDSSGQDGSGNGIYARRYQADGTLQGNEFRVNTYTTGSQFIPRIGIAADGDFVITWSSSGQDGDGWGIYAQRYNADGTPQSNEFRINNTTTDDQFVSAIGMAATGSFVIAWESDQDGDGEGIYARRYNATGIPLSNEFKVNTYTTGNQENARVGMADNGDFVITWTSFGQDGDRWGVYAQRYDAAGTPQDGEFKVNTITSNSQEYPSVGVAADGDFVITWESSGHFSFRDGIFAQRYGRPSSVYLPLVIK